AQAADVLVIAAPQRVGQQIADQATDEAQQQGLTQAEHAAAGQHRQGEQQNGARYQQAHHRQAFDAGGDQQDQAQPLGMLGEPVDQELVPLAHAAFLG